MIMSFLVEWKEFLDFGEYFVGNKELSLTVKEGIKNNWFQFQLNILQTYVVRTIIKYVTMENMGRVCACVSVYMHACVRVYVWASERVFVY